MCFSEATSTIKSSIGILGGYSDGNSGSARAVRECPRVAVGISHFKGLCRAGSEPGTEPETEAGAGSGLGRGLSRRLSRGRSRGPRGRSVGYHLVGYAGEYRIELIENGLPVIGFPEHNEHGVVSSDCSGHR